jgi:hypothetical protein
LKISTRLKPYHIKVKDLKIFDEEWSTYDSFDIMAPYLKKTINISIAYGSISKTYENLNFKIGCTGESRTKILNSFDLIVNYIIIILEQGMGG